MDQNNPVDFSREIGYNEPNVIDEVVIKMDEQIPVNDTSCRHENLIPDKDDVLGGAVYHGCANLKCGVGFYIKT